MPITVLLADDSEFMRKAIVKLLADEPRIQLVGEASGFADTIAKNAELQPQVLLMDLHMHDEHSFPPQRVKIQVHEHTECLIAMSVWNDERAHNLASQFGAHHLLDKCRLYSDLIPAVLLHCTDEGTLEPCDTAAQIQTAQ
jgi:DNA-binding NarL/FixJ family response regulator